MNAAWSDTVRREICKALSDMVPERIGLETNIDPGQNLLEFIDSLQFVYLVSAVEEALKIELHLRTVNLETIVQIDDLVDYIVETAPRPATLT